MHRSPVDSPHKGPVKEAFPCRDVILIFEKNGRELPIVHCTHVTLLPNLFVLRARKSLRHHEKMPSMMDKMLQKQHRSCSIGDKVELRF